MDRRWLEESEMAGHWVDEESFRVWGDSWLHQKVIDLINGSDQYLWLISTTWWRKKCGPRQLPPALRLDGYCIFVVEQKHGTPLQHVHETNREGSVDDCFESVCRENGMAADPGYYQHLTKEQVSPIYPDAIGSRVQTLIPSCLRIHCRLRPCVHFSGPMLFSKRMNFLLATRH